MYFNFEIVSEEFNNDIIEDFELVRAERLAKRIGAYHAKHVYGGYFVNPSSGIHHKLN